MSLANKLGTLLIVGNHDPGSVFEEALNLEEGAPSFSATREAARRVFRKIRPAKTRKATLKIIADALVKDAVVMDWFADMYRQYRSINYQLVTDLIGEEVYEWKGSWELRDIDEFEDLSSDPYLVQAIQKAAARHKPTGTKVVGINWSEVDHLVSGIETRVRMSREGANKGAVEDLKKWVNQLQKELNK